MEAFEGLDERWAEDSWLNSLVFFGSPGWPVSFFGGPLFYTKHDNKLQDFYDSVNTPLDVLTDSRREGVIRVIERLNPNPGLFSLNGQLTGCLDGIMEQRHLYKRFDMQRGTKKRRFNVPHLYFRSFVEEHVLPFVKSFPVHRACHGGEKGWSVARSLATHIPVRSALSFDMQSAFSQAKINNVFDFYYNSLEGRADNDQDRINVAGFLSGISTVGLEMIEMSGRRGRLDISGREKFENSELPQGSPLSMALFNRLMFSADEELERQAKKKGIRYSRWVDDFIFSSMKRRNFDEFSKMLRIAQASFYLAPEKVFFSYQGPAYLLGHRLNYDSVEKLDKDEFNRRRPNPLTGRDLTETHSQGDIIYGDEDSYDFPVIEDWEKE
jgi:hypothetical protein